MPCMSKKSPDGSPGRKKPTFPSRQKVTYPAIPKEYAELLRSLTADGEKYEGRSVSFLAKLAVRAFLQAEGKLDAKGRPVPPG